MVELLAKTPCDGALPVEIGALCLREIDPGPLTLLLPLPGAQTALGEAVETSFSLMLPDPGQFSQANGVSLIWFGRLQWLLAGAVPDPALMEHASLSEQSDAWAVVELSGEGARDVLARLCPIDLRVAQFGPAQVVRTALGHMTVAVMCLEEQRFRIFAFRSMAHTLVHDLTTAMRSVNAQING